MAVAPSVATSTADDNRLHSASFRITTHILSIEERHLAALAACSLCLIAIVRAVWHPAYIRYTSLVALQRDPDLQSTVSRTQPLSLTVLGKSKSPPASQSEESAQPVQTERISLAVASLSIKHSTPCANRTKTTGPRPSGCRRSAGRSVLPSMSGGVRSTDNSRTDSRYTVASALATAFAAETSETDGRHHEESLLLLRQKTPASSLCSGDVEPTRAVRRSQIRAETVAETHARYIYCYT